MKKETLYFECYAGISGDMAVAALIDAGADSEVLKKGLASLPLEGYIAEIRRVTKNGIEACDFNVILKEPFQETPVEAFLNEMHTGHMTNEEHEHHSHQHSEHEHHSHQHSEREHHGHHEHIHRNLHDVEHIISQADITEGAKEVAFRIFGILAEAEAKAHGKPIEEVHFHEVGAVDSIVDITAVGICVDNLGINEAVFSVLYEGQGSIPCQHGILPVPVPAVVNIVESHQLPMKIVKVFGELVTPTGAAIAAALSTTKQIPSQYTIKKTGIGAGKRNYNNTPGILRVFVLAEDEQKQEMWELRTNLDDSSGECLSYVMEKLLEAGCADVFFVPVIMKKSRPAYMLSVLCLDEIRCKAEEIIFRHTTTIGIRRSRVERTVLKRTIREMETVYGSVRIKVCEGEGYFFYPEYDDVRRICDNTGKSFQTIYAAIKKEGEYQIKKELEV